MPKLITAALFCLLILMPRPAAAQTFPDLEPDVLFGLPSETEDTLILSASGSYLGPSDFKSDSGGVEIAEASISAKYSKFTITYNQSHFFWKGRDELPIDANGQAPWDVLHNLSFRAKILRGIFWGKWHYWLHGEVSSAFEEDFPGAVGAGLNGELAFDIWEGWMVGATAKTLLLNPLNQDLFGDIEFGIALHVSEKQFREAMKALGLVSGDNKKKGRIGARFVFSGINRTYRLSSANPVHQNGYLGIRRTKIGAYLDYAVTPNFTFSLGPEYHFFRKYELYNSTGALRNSHKIEPTLGGFAEISWRF